MISRVMWLIKGKHRHLKAAALSEYLDGRLEGAALARVERSLTECSACREELGSLQATVAALRQLPVEAPARDFMMAAPPFRPARLRSTPLARASMWAYAGAASVAALVLTVLASADATGLLAPSQPGFDEASTAAFDVPVSMEDYQSDAAAERAEAFDDSMAMADEGAAATTAPLITAEPVAEMELAGTLDETDASITAESAVVVDALDTDETMATMDAAESFDDSEQMATESAYALDDADGMADADSAPESTDAFDGSDAMATADSVPESVDVFDDSDGTMAADFAEDAAETFDDSDGMADDAFGDSDGMMADDSADDAGDAFDDADGMMADDFADDAADAFDDSDGMVDADPAAQATDALDDADTAPAADPAAEQTEVFDSGAMPAVEAAIAAAEAAAEAAKTATVEAAMAAAAEAAQAAAAEAAQAAAAEAANAAKAAAATLAREPTEAPLQETETEAGPTVEALRPGPQEPGTALYWRIVQGIAGALALLFLAAFAVKWRASRGDGAARG